MMERGYGGFVSVECVALGMGRAQDEVQVPHRPLGKCEA